MYLSVWQPFADYGDRKERLSIRCEENLSQLRGGVILRIESTCQDATKALGVPLMHPRTNRTQCLLHGQLIDTVRVLPTDIATMHLPPVVNISLQNGKAGDRLGVIAVDSIHSAVFREMSYAPPETTKECQSGVYALPVWRISYSCFSY